MSVNQWKEIQFQARDPANSKPGEPAFTTVLTTGAMIVDTREEDRASQSVDVNTEVIRVKLRATSGVIALDFSSITSALYDSNRYSILANNRGIEGAERGYHYVSLKRDK